MVDGGGQQRAGDASMDPAQAMPARQAAEIEELRGQLADQQFVAALRGGLTLAATTGLLASPVTHARFLEMIVATAARVIAARAATLFLLDPATQELVFEVALGQKAAEVKKFRLPLGHGIAGLVAVTGQPLIVSDAQNDPRQAAEIAQAVGYAPRSILCVPLPLFYNDQIVGVLELLDKEGAPAFGPADLEILGLFAHQAAVAIEQSRTHRNLTVLLSEALAALADLPPAQQERLQQGAHAFVARTEEDPVYRQALALARLVQEIAAQGEQEATACLGMLRSFATYLRARPAGTGAWGGVS
jgi:GAF domain-containing protein